MKQDENLQFYYPYCKLIRIFGIRAFKKKIMKSVVVPTYISADGPLLEDKLMLPILFISSSRHSNKTPEKLNEVWNISVEQAKMTFNATTQHRI